MFPLNVQKLVFSKPNTKFPLLRLTFPISVNNNSILCNIQIKITESSWISFYYAPIQLTEKLIAPIFKKLTFTSSHPSHVISHLLNWCSSLRLCPATVYYSQIVRVILSQ